MSEPISVLFVCLGNICRSPLAEALFRQVVEEAGLAGRFHIDSAGTSSYHIGEPPDRRTTEVAALRGVEVVGESRQVTSRDARKFNYLIAMDADNRIQVERLVERLADANGRPELHLLREFDPEANGDLEVPDPYFGGPQGFENVHDLVERSARGLLEYLVERHGL
ncbi:MAG: low molecular weight protein-tyrosine-phosphatase [Gemmatimonadota bacterium]